MTRERSPAVIASLAAALVFVLAAGVPRASADIFTSQINTPNTALSGFAGPYALVTVNLTSSTTATVTFTSDTANGNIYLMGDGGSADLNVNGTYTLGTVTESNAGTGFTPTFVNNTPGTVDGFGIFNLSLNNFNGFSDSADTITFTLTDTSGTWSSAANVLTPNAAGFDAAAHIFVTSFPANVGNGAKATGYAAEGPSTPAPEASAVTLASLVLLPFGVLVLRARRNGLA